jgi:GGDEF domain-containing protein
MAVEIERRRVLVAARPSEAAELHGLFADAALEGWDLLDADGVARARFLLQHNPCDVLIVDEGLYHTAGPVGLAWLVQDRDTPVICLTGMEAETVAQAYQQGVHLCVPRRLALEHPPLLAAALRRAAGAADAQRSARRTKEGLYQCRRQVDRLVNLLWRTVPGEAQRQWLPQRHILERLQEEVSRSGRHGNVFTVALGELQEADGAADGRELPEWTTDALVRAKRRCDVAGHYGLNGFLLLMVHTPKEGAVTCCRRLQKYLANTAPTGPRGPIRASFGLSSFAANNATSQSILSRAEKHLEVARGGAAGGVVTD